MLAGPRGRSGSVTTSCALYAPSARSRRTTTFVLTLAFFPPTAEVKTTVYGVFSTNDGLNSVTGSPAYVTFGRTLAGGGGGFWQPQAPCAARGGGGRKDGVEGK